MKIPSKSYLGFVLVKENWKNTEVKRIKPKYYFVAFGPQISIKAPNFKKVTVGMIFITKEVSGKIGQAVEEQKRLHTVKSHFKALGLYNFKRSFGWAYKRGGGGGAYIRVGL